MRRHPDFFSDPELPLIYMARTLRDALRLEKLLEEAAIDYLVETGTYLGGLLFKRDLTGAFFYVAPKDQAVAESLLVRNRYRPYRKSDGVADEAVLQNGQMHP